MTSKTSQKTEDMLDQTFQNFDSEQTVTATQGGGSGTPTQPKNNNVKLIIGLGVGCILISGYLLVLRPSLDAQNANQNASIPPAQQVAVNVPPPAEPVQVPQPAQEPAPVAVVQQPETLAPQIQPVQTVGQADVQPQSAIVNVQVTGQPAQVVNPVQQQMAIEQPVSTLLNNAQVPNINVQPQAQIVQPQVQGQEMVAQPIQQDAIQKQQSVVVDVAQNGQQVDVKVEQPKVVANFVVDDIVARLDKQNSEFKAIFTDIDGKLVSIQTSITEQKDINQKVDSRLTALESKSVVGTAAVTPKKPVAVKQSKPKTEKTEVVIKEKDIVEKVTIKTKTPTKVSIHSIYGGRVWVKNSDGSLSTYSAGDKLPNGEVIKVVDDENLEIVTDTRVIKN